eukprot:gnl/Chilomastix_cuspidata/2995.p1 GENE.gnl/Chilomastix_cuspidata/2995~~gnl/Chilomastix_cuspidata/2995.p1  ORF type:complete len:331 (+),score=189.54 gnl/Chilomastix_cuspidata/2995:80-1072(+)
MSVARKLVSMNRRRFEEDGYNLDLAYITPRIIAMGFPATGVESLYRNKYTEALKFLDEKHGGHYRVYNLCSEDSHQYPSDFFHGCVQSYPFPDHNPPSFAMLAAFCEDAAAHLGAAAANVAVVHCKAGKSRTGVMICAYLLHTRFLPTPLEVMAFYGAKRAHDNKGLTIPSQRRYIEYYGQQLAAGGAVAARVFRLVDVDARGMFASAKSFGAHVLIGQAEIWRGGGKVVQAENERRDGLTPMALLRTGAASVLVSHDVRVELLLNRERIGHFWFNTAFIAGGAADPPLCRLTFRKALIDRLHKDRKHRKTPEAFRVSVTLERLLGGAAQ